eukprot:757128-Hanusia_phi.AAC.3
MKGRCARMIVVSCEKKQVSPRRQSEARAGRQSQHDRRGGRGGEGRGGKKEQRREFLQRRDLFRQQVNKGDVRKNADACHVCHSGQTTSRVPMP